MMHHEVLSLNGKELNRLIGKFTGVKFVKLWNFLKNSISWWLLSACSDSVFRGNFLSLYLLTNFGVLEITVASVLFFIFTPIVATEITVKFIGANSLLRCLGSLFVQV
jgi:hypothetical protein